MGETLFVGLIMGLIGSLIVYLDNKASQKRLLKKTQKFNMWFEKNITSKGGVRKMYEDVFDYYGKKYELDQSYDEGHHYFLRNEKFIFVIIVQSFNSDLLTVAISKVENIKSLVELQFYILKPQNEIIEQFDKVIERKWGK